MADERSFRPASRRFERAVPVSGSDGNSSWARIPTTFREADGSLPQPWEDIFGPLRQSRIDDLIVVNARNEPVGLVDSQDLPKLKIV